MPGRTDVPSAKEWVTETLNDQSESGPLLRKGRSPFKLSTPRQSSDSRMTKLRSPRTATMGCTTAGPMGPVRSPKPAGVQFSGAMPRPSQKSLNFAAKALPNAGLFQNASRANPQSTPAASGLQMLKGLRAGTFWNTLTTPESKVMSKLPHSNSNCGVRFISPSNVYSP